MSKFWKNLDSKFDESCFLARNKNTNSFIRYVDQYETWREGRWTNEMERGWAKKKRGNEFETREEGGAFRSTEFRGKKLHSYKIIYEVGQ